MVGAGIYVVPFMIQRHVPGIGSGVLLAYLLAAVPAILAGLAYAVLASAMPRAGGSYVYASRGLSPYLGFIASFSQWFSLCIAIGVVSYLLTPFVRDVALAAGSSAVARWLDVPAVRLLLPLGVLWCFAGVNLRGLETYQRVLLPLLGLTFLLGAVVIVAGFVLGPAAAPEPPGPVAPPATPGTVVTAAALLFSSFIGFDAIAQAGGEARDPSRTLPLAIGLAIGIVTVFYALFAGAVYHAVPWTVVRDEAMRHDTSAAALLGARLPAALRLAVVAGAAVALVKDLPAMLLGVSRLMFAWAEDGIVPRVVASVHPRHHTPRVAILVSAAVASLGIVGCRLAGDFFLGVDILVTSMLVNFLLMCGSVLALPARNPGLAQQIRVLRSPSARRVVGVTGIALLGALLVVHTARDLGASGQPWYLRSTVVWLGVMAMGSAVYWRELRGLRQRGVDVQALFAALPPE